MINTFYIVSNIDVNLVNLIAFCSGDTTSQRYSLDGTKVVLNCICEAIIWAGYIPITHSEAIILMQTAEWQLPTIS